MAFSLPEYCRLFAQKKAYQGGFTGTPGPPPSYAPAVYFIIVSLILPTSSPFLIFLSADEDVTLAGFKEKFKTYVIVDSSGVNMWMSPASFKSSCDMVIRFYPFDRQTCHLTFGSLTFDSRLLKMMNKDDSHSTSGWTEKKLVLILMYR